MKVNKIFNEDCFQTIKYIAGQGRKVQMVITSPPYNTARNSTDSKRRDNHEARYDIHLDDMTDNEYLEWTVDLFKGFDGILEKNGVVLYNMSYGTDTQNYKEYYKPNEIMYRVINEILVETNFTIADTIVWKKSSALPNNVSSNKLTRICEFVFVFCRKSELKTFQCNKKVKSVSKRGQNYYENMFNYIEAKNNDGSNKLNKATYSSDLVTQLIDMYAKPKGIVYDPFIGTGTTALACAMRGLKYIGSEISQDQVKFARKRIKAYRDSVKDS